jgi:hypothetical protein
MCIEKRAIVRRTSSCLVMIPLNQTHNGLFGSSLSLGELPIDILADSISPPARIVMLWCNGFLGGEWWWVCH